jgi:hypothetical protein
MKNFGFIKSVYNELLSESISEKNSETKDVFKKYLKFIKENEILKTQFLIYKNIEDKIEENEAKAVEYIKENIALMNNYSKKEILESNKKLTKIISDKIGTFKTMYNESRMKPLHESITTLIFTEKNAATIDKIIESIGVASDYIKSQSVRSVKNMNESLGVSNEVLTSVVVDKYNETYDQLSESAKKLIGVVVDSTENEKIEFYKNVLKECVDLVNTKLKEADLVLKETLLSLKENLLDRNFNIKTFEQDVLKMFKLRDDLKD